MTGLAVVVEDVHWAEVKGLYSAGRGGASGEPWRRWCRVDVVHVVQIVRTGVCDRPFGQVGGSPVQAVADGGISGIVMLPYRNVAR